MICPPRLQISIAGDARDGVAAELASVEAEAGMVEEPEALQDAR
jgi:hypothetical protein